MIRRVDHESYTCDCASPSRNSEMYHHSHEDCHLKEYATSNYMYMHILQEAPDL